MRYKQVVVVRSDLNMSCGKIAAQVAHASLEASIRVMKEDRRTFENWRSEGAKKVVLSVDSEGELLRVFEEARGSGLPAVLIRDAGLTELEPGTPTAVGIGPAEEERIDRVTGRLRLYR